MGRDFQARGHEAGRAVGAARRGCEACHANGKFIKARYKGGVAVGNEIITSKFRIEDADPAKQRMESPADLLKQINLNEAKKDETTHELKITPSKEKNTIPTPEVLLKAPSLEQITPPPVPVNATETKPQKKKVLIEELPSPSSKQEKLRTGGADKPTNAKQTASSVPNAASKPTAQAKRRRAAAQ